MNVAHIPTPEGPSAASVFIASGPTTPTCGAFDIHYVEDEAEDGLLVKSTGGITIVEELAPVLR
jgi:hypothetical protein